MTFKCVCHIVDWPLNSNMSCQILLWTSTWEIYFVFIVPEKRFSCGVLYRTRKGRLFCFGFLYFTSNLHFMHLRPPPILHLASFDLETHSASFSVFIFVFQLTSDLSLFFHLSLYFVFVLAFDAYKASTGFPLRLL